MHTFTITRDHRLKGEPHVWTRRIKNRRGWEGRILGVRWFIERPRAP